jgi:hypothetical protein
MDRAGHQLLARAAFTEQQHSGVGRRCAFDGFEHVLERRTAADNLVFRFHRQLEGAVFLLQLTDFEPLADRDEHAFAGKGFFDEVEGPEAGGVHRVGNGAMAGDHCDWDGLIDLADLREGFEPVHARHLDVEDDHVRCVALDRGNAFRTGGRSDEFVVFVFEDHPQRVADSGLVVDDQNAGFQHERSDFTARA